jgi:DNA-binding NarL/FixJ family response regulator
MGFLTEREKTIIELLSKGKNVTDIAKELDVSITSVSRSISRIRMKCLEIEDDIRYLTEIGFIQIKNNKLTFLARDPKALGQTAK